MTQKRSFEKQKAKNTAFMGSEPRIPGCQSDTLPQDHASQTPYHNVYIYIYHVYI